MPFVEYPIELDDVSKYGAWRIAQPPLVACNRVYKRDSRRRSRLLACSWTRLSIWRGVGDIVASSAAALQVVRLAYAYYDRMSVLCC
jgi:anti-sigma-K factor RskA